MVSLDFTSSKQKGSDCLAPRGGCSSLGRWCGSLCRPGACSLCLCSQTGCPELCPQGSSCETESRSCRRCTTAGLLGGGAGHGAPCALCPGPHRGLCRKDTASRSLSLCGRENPVASMEVPGEVRPPQYSERIP